MNLSPSWWIDFADRKRGVTAQLLSRSYAIPPNCRYGRVYFHRQTHTTADDNLRKANIDILHHPRRVLRLCTSHRPRPSLQLPPLRHTYFRGRLNSLYYNPNRCHLRRSVSKPLPENQNMAHRHFALPRMRPSIDRPLWSPLFHVGNTARLGCYCSTDKPGEQDYRDDVG